MSNIRKTVVSNSEKKFLLKSLGEWMRLDGRAFDEFREVQIDFGKDWGCCYVSLGKTRALAQVSCEIEEPKSSRPSEGILNVNVELNPIADPNFEAGRQSDLSVQINRLLEKCLKDSKAVDLESLCIKMNEKVWAFRVDINILNHEGNILDCASIAALAALAHFRRPDVTCDGEEFKIHSYKQRDPIPTVIHHYPVCITYGIFNRGEFVTADPDLLEEGVADAFLSIGLNAYRELCGLHLGGKAVLSPNIILSTTSKAAARAAIVVQMVKDAVEKDCQKRSETKVMGFHNTIDLESVQLPAEDLSICLDQWSAASKKKGKKKKQETMEVESEIKVKEEDKDIKSKIENLGKGTAAMVPIEGTENTGWVVSDSDEEDEVVFVNEKAAKVETVELVGGSSSEEETVVVLNANSKTKRKKSKPKA